MHVTSFIPAFDTHCFIPEEYYCNEKKGKPRIVIDRILIFIGILSQESWRVIADKESKL